MTSSIKGKLLVTGGAGFIGKGVVRRALELGYKTTSFDLNECKVKGVESVIGDIRAREALTKAMDGNDYVIHLAAITSPLEFEKDMKGCNDINVTGTLNVFEAARQSKVKRVLYASSAAVYMNEFSETSVIPHFMLRNYYAKTKLINEMHAHSYRDAHGLDAVGLRFFNVYGPGENQKGAYASIISRIIASKAKGEKFVIYGDGTQARDHIHIDDASRITMLLLEKGKEEVYNVGTGTPLKYGDIAREILGENGFEYAENPLKSYQMLTKADTKRLLKAIGPYAFTDAKKAIKGMQGKD